MASRPSEEEKLQLLRQAKSRRLALTDDATKLMKTFQREFPESWDIYLTAVKAEGIIQEDVWRNVRETARKLFPGRQLVDITEVMLRMNHIALAQLGRADRDRI